MRYKNAKIIDMDLQIDWDSMIRRLENLDVPCIKPYVDEEEWKKQLEIIKAEDDNTRDGEQETGYRRFFQEWHDANIDFATTSLYNYFPYNHYDFEEVEGIFCKKINRKHHKSWFSKIDPGCWVPWHYDVEVDPALAKDLERYVVFVGAPKLGHIFMLGRDVSKSDCFYGMEHNQIIKWNYHEEWHAGGNLGFEPKWTYHIIVKKG